MTVELCIQLNDFAVPDRTIMRDVLRPEKFIERAIVHYDLAAAGTKEKRERWKSCLTAGAVVRRWSLPYVCL